MLSDADSRSAIEWYVGPWFGLPAEPAAGVEVKWVKCGIILPGGGVEVGTSLHGQGTVCNWCIFENANWRETIWTTAMGEGGIVECEADIEWNDGIEAECFVHDVLLMVRVVRL